MYGACTRQDINNIKGITRINWTLIIISAFKFREILTAPYAVILLTERKVKKPSHSWRPQRVKNFETTLKN
jgi:hypothetical protein